MKKKLLLIFLITLVGCDDSIINSSIGSFGSNSIIESSSSLNNSSINSSLSSSELIVGGSTELYKAKLENNVPKDYYESCRGLKGESLKNALHNIIKGHMSYKYSDTQPFYKVIDRDPYDSNKMYFIYTGLTNISTGYNKEHVWAKSHGKFEDKYPMHSDLHNLHPCNNNLNSSRGNLDFDEGGKVLSSYYGNNKIDNGNSFEPSDFSKGDVARTIFYMAVRYEGDNDEMDLEVSSPSSNNYYDFSSGADGIHGNFDALYKWATSGQDPVDDYEVSRNNIIYSDYQHNRNPFIDHPEFIQMIYDKKYDGPGALLDNNPYEEETEDMKISRFIELVNSINNVNSIDAKDAIERAEKIYQSLSSQSKENVGSYYQILMGKKSANEEFLFQYNIDNVIGLINQIGEVSLSSKDKIEEAEKEYDKLSSEQKILVTNYNILFLAREKYNELLKDNSTSNFIFDFESCTGASASYTNATVKYEDKEIRFSQCYKTSGEDGIRFGSKAKNKIDDKFSSAISGLGVYANSMELLFDVVGTKISLTSVSQFGTTTDLYLLKSNDGGKTWSLLESISDSSKFKSKNTHTFVLDSSYSRYAFVVDGDEPRLVVSSLEIK